MKTESKNKDELNRLAQLKWAMDEQNKLAAYLAKLDKGNAKNGK